MDSDSLAKILDMSTPYKSIGGVCQAISNHNLEQLSFLTTEIGYKTLVHDIGLSSLSIDVLFWESAMNNGRILASEKIETVADMFLLQNHDEYQILSVNSYSSNELMPIARITMVKIDGMWKFMSFTDP